MPPRVIQPYPSRRRRRGVGCGALIGVTLLLGLGLGAVLLLPLLPGLLIQAAGFTPAGPTHAVFEADNAPLLPIPVDGAALSAASLTAGESLGQALTFPLDDSTPGLDIHRDMDGALIVTADEAALLSVCRAQTAYCDPGAPVSVRDLTVDLRPGGAVVYADVTLPQTGLRQRMGAVLRIDADAGGLNVAGIDIDGTLYSIPPDGLGISPAQLAAEVDAVLRGAALQVSGRIYRLRALSADETTLRMVWR